MSEYRIYRKALGTGNWGAIFATIPATAISWVDTFEGAGQGYEYKLVRIYRAAPGRRCETYIWGGVNFPALEQREKMILLVDKTIALPLTTEITRLEEDLIGDGWAVVRLDVERSMSALSVKELITQEWLADIEVKAVFILGHVAVPYSGNLNPDAHSDHKGAWHADVYYGATDFNFSDETVNNTVASRPENKNIVGDGKFDQSSLVSAVNLLEVGRVDLFNMPAFSLSDTALLRRYLDKNHNYRQGITKTIKRALIDDNFGWFSGRLLRVVAGGILSPW